MDADKRVVVLLNHFWYQQGASQVAQVVSQQAHMPKAFSVVIGKIPAFGCARKMLVFAVQLAVGRIVVDMARNRQVEMCISLLILPSNKSRRMLNHERQCCCSRNIHVTTLRLKFAGTGAPTRPTLK